MQAQPLVANVERGGIIAEKDISIMLLGTSDYKHLTFPFWDGDKGFCGSGRLPKIFDLAFAFYNPRRGRPPGWKVG